MLGRHGHASSLGGWVPEARIRGAVLETMRAHPEVWWEGCDLSLVLGLPCNRGEGLCSRMHKQGLVERIGRGGPGQNYRFRVRPGARASWEKVSLRQGVHQEVWATVRDNPGLTYRDYATLLDHPSRPLAAILSQMHKKGYLTREGRGGSIKQVRRAAGHPVRDLNTYRYFANLDNPPPELRHV